MSDQTPNSSEDFNGSEPSMEDILASIRKIISEDEPVALESPEDIVPVEVVGDESASNVNNILPEFGSAPKQLNVSETLETPSANLADDEGMVDLDVEDVLSGLNDDLASDAEIEMAEVESAILAETENSSVSESGDVESEDDILAFLDKVVPMETDVSDDVTTEALEKVDDFAQPSAAFAPAAGIGAAAAAGAALVQSDAGASSDDVDMDSLLDDILKTPEDEILDIAPDSLDEDIDEILKFSEDTFVSEEESDLELVKSLMADLADDPGDIETEEDIDELLAIPEFDDAADGTVDEDIAVADDSEIFETSELAEAAEIVAEDEIATEQDEDILGEILDMTLDDELEAQPEDIDIAALTSLDDVAAAEQDNVLENALDVETIIEDVTLPDEAIDIASDEPMSLSDIAAAAEADAASVESDDLVSPLAAVAGSAAAGAGLAALAAKVAEPGTEDVDAIAETSSAQEQDIETQLTETEILPTQETSMPVKAVKTDAIIDEVTETAAIGAFAELNQVVEDQAVFNERGPRIGDLVQEALRPMLKEWLDANLKGIVERAVTKEVKRISKGQ